MACRCWKIKDRIAKDKQNLHLKNLVSLMNQVVKAHTEVASRATGPHFEPGRSKSSALSCRSSLSLKRSPLLSILKKNGNWRSIHKRQSEMQKTGKQASNGRNYFQYNWEPEFACDFEDRIGPMGDGGKWLCSCKIAHRGMQCIINWVEKRLCFEDAMHKLNPRCKMLSHNHTHRSSPIREL